MVGGRRDLIPERGRRQRDNLPVETMVMLGGVEVGEGDAADGRGHIGAHDH
jgi:hypothetical protein